MPNPVLESVHPVVDAARHVRIHDDKLHEVAAWMAAEDLSWPEFFSPLHPKDERDCLDFIFLYNTINFAFTDFATREIFRVRYADREWSDTEAMVACLKRALDGGLPVLEGGFLADLTLGDLEKIFAGNIRMPMLDERLAIFREVGRRLVSDFQGRFHHFLADGPQRLYDPAGDRNGLLERLVDVFPSFFDSSSHQGRSVLFHKRAQLLWWMVSCLLRESNRVVIKDLDQLTAFADYIVPMALNLHGILRYEPALTQAIATGGLLGRDSEEEVEIRAATIWAVHRLTAEVNRLRPPDLQIIEPVVDARLWTRFHCTHARHHLTVTTAY
ncbi:MAG: queuosine salvage family protein [Acidobacteriota bacterium]|nr:queuosine salvage family protein [Acidobacteriota bacterium]